LDLYLIFGEKVKILRSMDGRFIVWLRYLCMDMWWIFFSLFGR